jgi:hypothetical protein
VASDERPRRRPIRPVIVLLIGMGFVLVGLALTTIAGDLSWFRAATALALLASGALGIRTIWVGNRSPRRDR